MLEFECSGCSLKHIQMADSFNKKEREKKKRKKNQEKQERRERRKQEGKTQEEFMYVDADGNLTPIPQDPSERKVALEDIEISIPKKEDTEPESPEREGKVKFFNSDKGYGFIIDNKTNESLFVHLNDLETEVNSGDSVTYEVNKGPRGRSAVKVRKAS